MICKYILFYYVHIIYYVHTYVVCPDGMEYRNCSWNLYCHNISSYYTCNKITPCRSGCFCAGKTVFNNGICSNATSCSGTAL